MIEKKTGGTSMKKNCMFEATLTGEVLHLVLCGEIDHHSAVAIRTEMDERIMASKPKKTAPGKE